MKYDIREISEFQRKQFQQINLQGINKKQEDKSLLQNPVQQNLTVFVQLKTNKH